MEKEKQIEEMAKIIKNAYSDCPLAKNGRTYVLCKDCQYSPDICTETQYAEALMDAGHGNVKEALKEFTEKLKAAEHRAEVAERALKIAVRELEKARGYSEREAVTLAGGIYIPEVIEQAKKELSEEKE